MFQRFQTLSYSTVLRRPHPPGCGCDLSCDRLQRVTWVRDAALLQWRKPRLHSHLLHTYYTPSSALDLWLTARGHPRPTEGTLCLRRAAPGKLWSQVLGRSWFLTSREQVGPHHVFSSQCMQINTHSSLSPTHCQFWIGESKLMRFVMLREAVWLWDSFYLVRMELALWKGWWDCSLLLEGDVFYERCKNPTV